MYGKRTLVYVTFLLFLETAFLMLNCLRLSQQYFVTTANISQVHLLEMLEQLSKIVRDLGKGKRGDYISECFLQSLPSFWISVEEI